MYKNGDFIQVLNNVSCHWLTISTIGASCGEVFVYHTLYSGAGSSLKDQMWGNKFSSTYPSHWDSTVAATRAIKPLFPPFDN